MYSFVMLLRVSHSGMKFCIFWSKVFLLLLSFGQLISFSVIGESSVSFGHISLSKRICLFWRIPFTDSQ